VTFVYAVDPGKATGFAILRYDDETPATVVNVKVLTDLSSVGHYARVAGSEGHTVVVEKFVLSAGNEFTADLTAKEVEGVLKYHLGDSIVWRSRADKAQVPDQTLKDYGMWVTGTDVDWEDGRDANDAIKHGLGHIAFTEKHIPTLRRYFRD
jgi:hypothetical protein